MGNEFNPKLHRKNAQPKKMSFDFASVVSPINAEIKDPKEILDTFKRWPLVPYAGNARYSTQGLLFFVNSARFISPTLGATHESIRSYVFEQKLRVTNKQDPDFNLEQEAQEITPERKMEFLRYLREKLVLAEDTSYTQMGENWYDSLKDNGNYFIELVHSETAGVKTTTVHYHPTANCCYWATLPTQPSCIAISPSWDINYLDKNPPKLLPLYPNYKKEGTKEVYRTIIHVKNGNFKYYGRPDWIAAWQSVYREYQDDDYMVKMASNQFTGQVFIELEDDDIENDEAFSDDEAVDAGFDGVVDRIEQNFTAKGDDPQTILVTSRPFGAKNAFIYQFKPVTDSKFLNSNATRARQRIIENTQWSERLLGNAVSEGFQSDAFESELKAKDRSVLKRYRGKIDYGWNVIIKEMLIFNDNKEFEDLSLSITAPPAQESNALGISDLKLVLDAYGVGVRSGAITPNKEDEQFFRNILAIPEINAAIDKSWTEDGDFRRPVTLKGSERAISQTNSNSE